MLDVRRTESRGRGGAGFAVLRGGSGSVSVAIMIQRVLVREANQASGATRTSSLPT